MLHITLARRAPTKFCSELVGSVPGSCDPFDPVKIKLSPDGKTSQSFGNRVQAVQTRASRLQRIHPLILPLIGPLNVTPQEFSNLQTSCPPLSSVREKVASGELNTMRDETSFKVRM